jgi:hypothetical protein
LFVVLSSQYVLSLQKDENPKGMVYMWHGGRAVEGQVRSDRLHRAPKFEGPPNPAALYSVVCLRSPAKAQQLAGYDHSISRRPPVVVSIGFLRVLIDPSSESRRDYFVSLGLHRAGVRRALPHLELVLAGVPVLPSPHLALGRLEAADRRLSA